MQNVVVHEDNQQRKAGKADPVTNVGRQQFAAREGECRKHHRGPRAGHAPTGNTGTWESQLSPCEESGKQGLPDKKETWRWAESNLAAQRAERDGTHKIKEEVSKVW